MIRMRQANAAAAVVAVALAGCRAPTQATIEISTDLGCSENPVTEIRAGRLLEDLESAAPLATTTACGPAGRIGSLVAVPGGDDDGPVAFKVAVTFTDAGGAPGVTREQCARNGEGVGCIIARRALRFVPHTALVVPIAMRRDCENVRCPPSQTCHQGACRPEGIDVGAVPSAPGACKPGGARCQDGVRETCSAQGQWQRGTTACLMTPSIAAGLAHTCAVLADGRVKCWGLNDLGQLGLGDWTNRGDNPNQMGAHLPAVDLGTGRYATAVAVGWNHTCALLDNQKIKCWGVNSWGQLGLGEGLDAGEGMGTHNRGHKPNQMGDNLPAVDLGRDRRARAITAGQEFTCALLDDDRVKCWGNNSDGRLGLGDTVSRGLHLHQMGDDLRPVDLGGDTVAAIAAGTAHTCAILGGGLVKCWGVNSSAGTLGLGDTRARGAKPGEMGANLPLVDLGTRLGMPVRATRIAAGLAHTCAALETGEIKCWGANGSGQLGLNDTRNRGAAPNQMGDRLPPTLVMPAHVAVKGLALGGLRSCALLDGNLECWGFRPIGSGGPLGASPGDIPRLLMPADVGTSRTVVFASVGGDHSCALLDNRQFKCWGDNASGQLGLGDMNSRGIEPGDGDRLPAVDLGP